MSASFAIQRTPRVAVSAFFLAAGAGIGAWAASLPALSARADLDKGELGIVLLCFALGAIATMTSVGRILPRYGTAAICLLSAVVFGGVLIAVPHSGNMALLAVLVFVGGGGFGALDVAMNTEASFLERQSGRHIMSSFHAVFSVGSLAGAGICGQLLRMGGDLALCLGVAGAAAIALALIARFWSDLPEEPDDAQVSATSDPRLGGAQKRHLWLLGGVAFLALFTEGALMDWSAIYLVGTVGASESTGAFGFAVFAATMAIGRAVGDMIMRVLGPALALRLGAGLVAGSLAFALTFSNVPVVFAALALCGIGIANVVPAIFSAAGRIGGDAAGAAMSRVTTMGYAGLLVGPPFIGFLAEGTTLAASLFAVVVAAVIVAAGASLVSVRGK
ncbi:MFS transporter [Arvimicrobium flavum]|uniref:MFS transporter n=1 Tax=Arvimicrobium flavum TaxID=3393320 RepID=UPI00237BB5DB|nr:MFS transporter [Mesorhizobium shangrilense]